MKPIRALIVDDESLGRINLRYALAEHPQWQIVAECASAASAREVLAQQAIDVVFLDVQMPKESGLGLARSLGQQAEPPLIIFVTAYHAHAVEAFEVHALDYLLKPFDDQRLESALQRAAALLAQRQTYGQALRAYLVNHGQQDQPNPSWQQLHVRSVGKIECILLQDIFWFSAAGNYVELHLAGRVVLHRQTLSQLENHLPSAAFIRVHRSAIIRLSQAASLQVVGDGVYALRLHCGDQVAVSERYVQALRTAMQQPSAS